MDEELSAKWDGYQAIARVYNVCKAYEENGIPIDHNKNNCDDWFEYEIVLMRDGKVVDVFDSLSETYNGVQKLSYKDAINAAKEILDDVREGNIREWFKVNKGGE